MSTHITMNLNTYSGAESAEQHIKADTRSLLSDTSDDEELVEQDTGRTTKEYNGKGKFNNVKVNSVAEDNLTAFKIIGKEIYDMYKETNDIDYMNRDIREIFEAVSTCYNELETISIDYRASCLEERCLVAKTEQLKTDLENSQSGFAENSSKLNTLCEVMEEKLKLVISEKSPKITMELFNIQTEVETLKKEQEQIEINIPKLIEQSKECEEMYMTINKRKSVLEELKTNAEVKIHKAELKLFEVVQKECEKQYQDSGGGGSGGSSITAFKKSKPKTKPDESNVEEYANYLSYTIVDKINEYTDLIEQKKSQLGITRNERIECSKRLNELILYESSLEIDLQRQIMEYKAYKSDYKGLIFNFNKEQFANIKTRLMENGISNGIIYYGTKSKDKLISASSYNPRFCVDDLEGKVHFFKEDWTHTKTLELSPENKKLPMKCRVKCPSETKDCNYNLSQMKLAIFLVNGFRINPCIKTW